MDFGAEGIAYLGRLRDFALRRLPGMIDPRTQLFSCRSTLDAGTWRNEGVSVRYSAIALLGLLEADRKGWPHVLPAERIALELHRRHRDVDNIGDAGLIVEALAGSVRRGLIARERLVEAADHALLLVRNDGAAKHRVVGSMEHAWMLMGLLACREHGFESGSHEAALEQVHADLLLNFNERSSLFSFSRKQRAGRPPKLKRLSFFAEQIYGILALSSYYEATGEQSALRRACSCADAIISFQTAAGGWPWRYHAPRGTLAEVYPLFSVHQDGMAPLALARLESLGAGRYLSKAFKGILWLDGRNEFRRPVFDESRDIVWRGVRRKGPFALISELNKTCALINVRSHRYTDRAAPILEFIPEVRSYHLGWILCAAAAVDDARERGARGRATTFHADGT
jgi:hypothetical protein